MASRVAGSALRRGPPKVLRKDLISNWKILRGDTVEVMCGRDRTKQGKVLKVNRKRNTVFVEGCNLVKRHVRGTAEQAGGIATKEASIHVSNVSLIDPKDGRPVRVRLKRNEKGEKVRVSQRSGEVVPRPESLLSPKRAKEINEETDTTPVDATTRTYDPNQPSIFRTAHIPFVIANPRRRPTATSAVAEKGATDDLKS